MLNLRQLSEPNPTEQDDPSYSRFSVPNFRVATSIFGNMGEPLHHGSPEELRRGSASDSELEVNNALTIFPAFILICSPLDNIYVCGGVGRMILSGLKARRAAQIKPYIVGQHNNYYLYCNISCSIPSYCMRLLDPSIFGIASAKRGFDAIGAKAREIAPHVFAGVNKRAVPRSCATLAADCLLPPTMTSLVFTPLDEIPKVLGRFEAARLLAYRHNRSTQSCDNRFAAARRGRSQSEKSSSHSSHGSCGTTQKPCQRP